MCIRDRATYEQIPVLFITGGTHPDHDSINTFRKRFLGELSDLFVKLLLIAHGMGILKLGDISMDGTKIKANASKHKAMSWELSLIHISEPTRLRRISYAVFCLK